MFRKKVPKTQQPDKVMYTLYTPHATIADRSWIGGTYRIVSIDPAVKNFAVRVEERPKDEALAVTETKTLLFDRLTLTDAITEDVCTSYDALTNFLDLHLNLFMTCHIVIMERQQIVENYKTIRIAQHTLSYFLIKLKNNELKPMIFEIDPKLKGQQLHAPPRLTQNELKTWSVQKATEILTIRSDQFALDILTDNKKSKKTKKKPDDLADTVCQIEALFKYFFINGSPLPKYLPPRIVIMNRSS